MLVEMAALILLILANKADALISILPSSDVPLISQGLASEWRACRLWNLEYLSKAIKGTLKFRLSRRNNQDIQWEPECPYLDATLKQFDDWIHGNSQDPNPFSQYPLDSWWAYADYVRMKNTELSELLKDIDFVTQFTFLDDVSPTFWLGSSKSCTICHRDTYGINLVVQICGSKRWILFPPTDGPFLYETRIPLEESTVFSAVNFPNPDLSKFPLLEKTSPFSVYLNPGDILFVPRNWWHFVESSADSPYTCSINVWLDQPALDDRVRVREALTQIAGLSLLSSCTSIDPISYLHPPEQELYLSETWFSFLFDRLCYLVSNNSKSCESDDQLPSKKVKLSNASWTRLSSSSISELFDFIGQSAPCIKELSRPGITYEKVIGAFLKSDVIELVAKHLEND